VYCGHLSGASRQRVGWFAVERLRLGETPRGYSTWSGDRKSRRSEDAPLEKSYPLGPGSGLFAVVIPARSGSESVGIPQFAYRQAVVALGDPEDSHRSGRHQSGARTNRLAYVPAYVLNDAARFEGRCKSAAGVASPCGHSRDAKHLHAGSAGCSAPSEQQGR